MMNSMTPRRVATTAALLCAAATPAALAADELPRGLARLAPADFAARIEILDDPIEPAVLLSTRAAHRQGLPMAGGFVEDAHLATEIDRTTGAARWQASFDLVNFARRAEVVVVSYRAGGVAQRAAPRSVTHHLAVCAPGDAADPCHARMRVVIALDEATVREIAGAYRPGSREAWRVGFVDTSGERLTAGLAPAEAAGLLLAVERWRDQRAAAVKPGTVFAAR